MLGNKALSRIIFEDEEKGLKTLHINEIRNLYYEGNSISKLQIQVATYVFELSAGNCRR